MAENQEDDSWIEGLRAEYQAKPSEKPSSAARAVPGVPVAAEEDDSWTEGLRAEYRGSQPPPEPETPGLLNKAGGFLKDAAIDLAVKGPVALGESVVGVADMATGNLVGDTLEKYAGYSPSTTMDYLNKQQTPELQAARQERSQAEGFFGKVGATLANPRLLLSDINASAVPSFAGMVAARAVGAQMLSRQLAARGIAEGTPAAARVAKAFFKNKGVITALTAAGAGTEGAMAAGSIQEAGREAGRDWSQTVLPAAAGGIGTAAFGVASSMLPGFRDVDTALAIRMLGEVGEGTLKQKAARVLRDTFKEGVLEELPQSTQEQIFQNVALGKPTFEGVDEAAAAGMMAGMGMGGGMSILSEVGGKKPTAVPPGPKALTPNTPQVKTPRTSQPGRLPGAPVEEEDNDNTPISEEWIKSTYEEILAEINAEKARQAGTPPPGAAPPGAPPTPPPPGSAPEPPVAGPIPGQTPPETGGIPGQTPPQAGQPIPPAGVTPPEQNIGQEPPVSGVPPATPPAPGEKQMTPEQKTLLATAIPAWKAYGFSPNETKKWLVQAMDAGIMDIDQALDFAVRGQLKEKGDRLAPEVVKPAAVPPVKTPAPTQAEIDARDKEAVLPGALPPAAVPTGKVEPKVPQKTGSELGSLFDPEAQQPERQGDLLGGKTPAKPTKTAAQELDEVEDVNGLIDEIWKGKPAEEAKPEAVPSKGKEAGAKIPAFDKVPDRESPEFKVQRKLEDNRWAALEKEYNAAKEGAEALPGVPVKHITKLRAIRGGGFSGQPLEVLETAYTDTRDRAATDAKRAELEEKYKDDKSVAISSSGIEPYRPRGGGEVQFEDWMKGKRPDLDEVATKYFERYLARAEKGKAGRKAEPEMPKVKAPKPAKPTAVPRKVTKIEEDFADALNIDDIPAFQPVMREGKEYPKDYDKINPMMDAAWKAWNERGGTLRGFLETVYNKLQAKGDYSQHMKSWAQDMKEARKSQKEEPKVAPKEETKPKTEPEPQETETPDDAFVKEPPSPALIPDTDLAAMGINLEEKTLRSGQKNILVTGLPWDIAEIPIKDVIRKWFGERGGKPNASAYYIEDRNTGKKVFQGWTIWNLPDGSELTTKGVAGVLKDKIRETRVERLAGIRRELDSRDDGDVVLDGETEKAAEVETSDMAGVGIDVREFVSSETERLIRDGGKAASMPAEVSDWQVEDVALAIRALEKKEKAFVLANAPGSGKTYVLGGIIRELRRRGYKKVLYTTMNKSLTAQNKKDLDEYGVELVEWETYAGSRKKSPDTSGYVLIFDEAQNIKNLDSKQGRAAQAIMEQALFTIMSSATPGESLVDLRYMEASGIFGPGKNSFIEWGKQFGLKTRLVTNPKTGRKDLEVVDGRFPVRGKGLKNARKWLIERGVYTNRPMRIPAEQIRSRFIKSSADDFYVKLFDQLGDVYSVALAMADEGEDFSIKGHYENMQKRVLESAKADATIKETLDLLDMGRRVATFTDTVSDKYIGRFRKRGDGTSDNYYTYPQMAQMYNDWLRLYKAKMATTEDKPFAEFIIKIAAAMHSMGIDHVLRSVPEETLEAVRKYKGGIYGTVEFTGRETEQKAKANLDSWLGGKAKFMLASIPKGGTGLSLHDKKGDQPTAQVVGGLPWTATKMQQLIGRTARYGMIGDVYQSYIFLDNIKFDKRLATKLARRMQDMGALVQGIDIKGAEKLETFDFSHGEAAVWGEYGKGKKKEARTAEQKIQDKLDEKEAKRSENLKKGDKFNAARDAKMALKFPEGSAIRWVLENGRLKKEFAEKWLKEASGEKKYPANFGRALITKRPDKGMRFEEAASAFYAQGRNTSQDPYDAAGKTADDFANRLIEEFNEMEGRFESGAPTEETRAADKEYQHYLNEVSKDNDLAVNLDVDEVRDWAKEHDIDEAQAVEDLIAKHHAEEAREGKENEGEAPFQPAMQGKGAGTSNRLPNGRTPEVERFVEVLKRQKGVAGNQKRTAAVNAIVSAEPTKSREVEGMIANIFHAVFGGDAKLNWFAGDPHLVGNGAILSDDKKNLFVNVNATDLLFGTLMHEEGHLRSAQDQSDLAAVLKRVVDPKKFKMFLDAYNVGMGKGREISEERGWHELQAELLRNEAANPGFWTELKKESVELYRRMADWVLKVFNAVGFKQKEYNKAEFYMKPELVAEGIAALRTHLKKMMMKMPDATMDDVVSVVGEDAVQFMPAFDAVPDIDRRRMISLIGRQLYGDTSEIAQTTLKELFQNSFDGVKDALSRGSIDKGKIDIHLLDDGYTLEIRDNGNGMSPETMQNAFLKIAGSEKLGATSSGGFGVAKAQFLFTNTRIEVSTVRDGVETTFSSTGEEIFSKFVNEEPLRLNREDTGKPNGTRVVISIPRKIKDSNTGVEKGVAGVGFYGVQTLLRNSPLFADIDVNVFRDGGTQIMSSETTQSGSAFPANEYTPFLEINFDWGTARVIIKDMESPPRENLIVLSNGLFQFATIVPQELQNQWGDPIKKKIFLNLEPNVSADEPGYPIAMNRKGVSEAFKKTFEEIKKYIWAVDRLAHVADTSQTYGKLEILSSHGNVSKVIDITPTVSVPSELSVPPVGSKVEVRDGKFYLEGKVLPQLSPEDLKSIDVNAVFSQYRLPSGTLGPRSAHHRDGVIIDIDPDDYMYGKYNGQSITAAARDKFGDKRVNKFFYDINSTFMEMRDWVSGNVERYLNLDDIPVSTFVEKIADGTLYGMYTKVPASSMFVSPFLYSKGAVTPNPKDTPTLLAARSLLHTMQHEIAHHISFGHDADFANVLGDLVSEMDAKGYNTYTNMTALAKTLAANEDIITFMFGGMQYAKSSAKSFEGQPVTKAKQGVSTGRVADRTGASQVGEQPGVPEGIGTGNTAGREVADNRGGAAQDEVGFQPPLVDTITKSETFGGERYDFKLTAYGKDGSLGMDVYAADKNGTNIGGAYLKPIKGTKDFYIAQIDVQKDRRERGIGKAIERMANKYIRQNGGKMGSGTVVGKENPERWRKAEAEGRAVRAPESNVTDFWADVNYQPVLDNLKREVGEILGTTKDNIIEVKDEFRKIINPSNMNAPGAMAGSIKRMANIVRAWNSERANKNWIAEKLLRGYDRTIGKLTEAQKLKTIDFFEREIRENRPIDSYPELTGLPQKTKDKLVELSEVRRSIIEPLWEIVMEQKGIETFIQDYFPHFWKDPQRARNVMAEILGKRPLAGSQQFLKKRIIDFIEEGLAMDLELESTDPIENILRINAMLTRSIMAHEIKLEATNPDNRLWYLSRNFGRDLPTLHDINGKPIGWTKIDDLSALVGPKGIHGEYYAPDPVARIVNNFVSPGLMGRSKTYAGMRWMGNLMNSIQLGLSAFHAMFTSMDAIVSGAALGIQEMLRGDIQKGLVRATKSVTMPIAELPRIFMRGKEMEKEFLAGVFNDPRMAQAFVSSGGRIAMDAFYKLGAVGRFGEAIRKGNALHAIGLAPFAAIEKTMVPVMEVWVPRLKMGMFADMMQSQFEYWDKRGIVASEEMIRDKGGEIWNSVENRMGQLAYDNLFWNKVFKDLAMVSVRSVGWNLGTIREFGGATSDVATTAFHAGKRAVGMNYDPDKILFKKGPGGVEITPRVAYAAAMPFIIGFIGALVMALFSGGPPEEPKDFFFPKTGRKRPDGEDERLSIPSYMKDIYPFIYYSLTGQPGKIGTMASHKMHPLISAVSDMMTNSDYYGTEVRDANDPFVKQMADAAKYLGEQMMPFSVRGALKATETTKTPEESATATAASFLGLNPAPKYITMSKADEKMADYFQTKRQTGISRETMEERKAKGKITQLLRMGRASEARATSKEFGLTRKEWERQVKKSKVDARLNSFKAVGDVETAVEVYLAADKAEKALYRRALRSKIDNSTVLSNREKQEFRRMMLRG